MAPEGRESRDLGSGGGNFILGETITSPGIKLPHYYFRPVLQTHSLPLCLFLGFIFLLCLFRIQLCSCTHLVSQVDNFMACF